LKPNKSFSQLTPYSQDILENWNFQLPHYNSFKKLWQYLFFSDLFFSEHTKQCGALFCLTFCRLLYPIRKDKCGALDGGFHFHRKSLLPCQQLSLLESLMPDVLPPALPYKEGQDRSGAQAE
jgi:hypothetical protein